MASQEELDRRLAEELHNEELRSLNVSSQSMVNDLEEDRLLAEKLQREEEAEYEEFNKTPDSVPKSELPSAASNVRNNLPSTSKDNRYQKLFAEHQNLSLVDSVWEQIDPTPDIHALFIAFDNRFFAGFLKSCEVRWSPRMTLCAGLCCFQPRSRFCSIRLSKPLLSLRPRSDLVETLLHEMIHAFLFLTNNNQDRDGHGPEFHKHMWRINKEAGTKISVYHSFHDEVRHFKVHHWRCNGPCQNRPPYFGWVKRSMNRAPAKTDFWWADHQRTCGGEYIKVSGPEKQVKEPKTKQSQNGTDAPRAPSPLRKFFKPNGSSTPLSQPGPSGSGSGAGGSKLGSTGNSSSAGQSTSGIGKSGSTKRPEHQSNITSWLPKPPSGTTTPDLNNDRVSGFGGGRTQTPRGRVTAPSQSTRGPSGPATGRGDFGSGSSGAAPQPRPNIGGLPRMRGGAGFGSRVVTIKGPVRSDHVLPTSQTNAVDSSFSPSVRAGGQGRLFRPFQGTGNVLGGSATLGRPGSSQNPNIRPQSSLLERFSKPANSTNTATNPPPLRKKTSQRLLDIFSSDEDEPQTASEQIRPKPEVKTKVTKETQPPVKTEVKLEKEEKKPLKREFKDEPSTSQRPPKSMKREPRGEASTSRQVSSDPEVIVIPPRDVEVVCPVCSSTVLESKINSHIDECLK